MRKQIKSTLVLFCICAVVAVMMAFVNAFTAPIIEANENAAANEALVEVLPGGEGFALADISDKTLPAGVVEVYTENSGGYVVRIVTSGYAQGMTIMCGVKDGKITGTKCLSSGETLGYEKTYGENFVGKDEGGVSGVATISGATKTTAAYKQAMIDALNTAIIMGGGSVDIRTEEEILMDNLNAALPEANGEFEKLFFVEVVDVDAVYVAKNGAGRVYKLGEYFVPVPAGSEAADSDFKATVDAASAILDASEVTAIDLSAYEGLPTALTEAQKTASGNYVFTLKGSGYGIQGEYHPSGEYIMIKVSLTADGKIIDTLTLSQKESDGIGSVCGEEKFYGQFDGKTAENYKEIDVISGATITTNGYLKAIERAFGALEILTGGGEIEE